jgi:hypothetical protein
VSAVHEAGHAVLQHALGGTIHFVSIVPSEALQTRAFMMRTADPIDWRDHLVVLAAGPIAETLVCRWQTYPCPVEAFDADATGDCARIAALARSKDPDHADDLYRAAFADAADMLDRPQTWRAVLDLGRLLEAREMDGPDVHSLIETHLAAGSYAGRRNHYGHQTIDR